MTDLSPPRRDSDPKEIIEIHERLVRVETEFENIRGVLTEHVQFSTSDRVKLEEALRNVQRELMLIPSTHADDHTFLRAWIDRERRRNERWDKIMTSFFGWLLIGVTGYIGTKGIELLVNFFRR